MKGIKTVGKMSGRIKVEVHNEHDELIHLEEKSNSIESVAVQRLGGALVNPTYNWGGAQGNVNNVIALDSISGAHTTSLSVDLGGSSLIYNPVGSEWESIGCILIKNSSSDYAVMGTTTAPALSGDVITVNGSVTGVATTWATAQMGALREFNTASSGVVAWCQKWADGDFDDVAVTAVDTITITWTLTLAEA